MSLDAIKVSVRAVLSEKRYVHTLGVVESAAELARLHGEDVVRAEIAALLHDVAKELPLSDMKATLFVSEYADFVGHSEKVWHAPVGALVARAEYGILDEDILNAIVYHTTGRAGMSVLEKIVYIADYIEPGRRQSGVDVARASVHDLDLAMLVILEQAIAKLTDAGGSQDGIHPDTLAAFAYYQGKVEPSVSEFRKCLSI